MEQPKIGVGSVATEVHRDADEVVLHSVGISTRAEGRQQVAVCFQPAGDAPEHVGVLDAWNVSQRVERSDCIKRVWRQLDSGDVGLGEPGGRDPVLSAAQLLCRDVDAEDVVLFGEPGCAGDSRAAAQIDNLRSGLEPCEQLVEEAKP
ncbi:hypothetical protein RM423_24245, partial [Jatrophihabitans sp. DSM 44399]|nr:hypothetical protein [Jatrophihabitans sp. DSM 44399]